MTPQLELASLIELVNAAECCVPCDSGSGHCKLESAIHKALPALHSVIGRLKIEAAFPQTKSGQEDLTV